MVPKKRRRYIDYFLDNFKFVITLDPSVYGSVGEDKTKKDEKRQSNKQS